MPHIIEPFHRSPNPTTFKSYAHGAISAQNGTTNLSEQWKDPKTQEIFEHVKQSLKANTNLSASASIPAHGWAERVRKRGESKKSTGKDSLEETTSILTDQQVSGILEEFQKRYPQIKLDTQDGNGKLRVGWSFYPF